jgi:hypothetical protein
MDGGLGRRPYVYNPADADYPMSARMAEAPETLPDRKFWGHRAWTGDQNGTSQCVGYGWTHNLASEPINTPLDVPCAVVSEQLYDAAQLIDEWSDTPPADGTSVRAGARALRAMGKISAWHNAFDVASVRDAILGLGPVVLGINWYDSFDDPHENPDGSFTLRLPSTAKIRGGHCVCAIGEQTVYDYSLILNSWGPSYAKDGVVRMPNRILARLLREGGEAVIATEAAR